MRVHRAVVLHHCQQGCSPPVVPLAVRPPSAVVPLLPDLLLLLSLQRSALRSWCSSTKQHEQACLNS